MHTNPTSGLLGRVLCVTIFLALYVTSLLFPAFHLANGKITDSLLVLLMGWSAILGWQFAWIANPIAFMAVVFFLYGSFRNSLWFALLAATVSLNTFTMINEEVVLDESGTSARVTQLGEGAYFWLASMLFLLICCATYAWRARTVSKRAL